MQLCNQGRRLSFSNGGTLLRVVKGLGVSFPRKFSNVCPKNQPGISVKGQVFSVLVFYKCLFPSSY